MDKELKQKLESKKSNGKTKKGCASCKKKAAIPITLPQLIEEEPIDIFFPTREVIHLAYIELGNRVENKREFINGVYRALFNEDFNFDCGGCASSQAMKLKNYINEVLKIPV